MTERMTESFLADCRARLAFDVLAHTWTPVVLFGLAAGPRRPGELRAAIGGVSPKVLTQALRRMERDGLVSRRRYGGAPPRVEYVLTSAGRALLEAVRPLGDWAVLHGDAVLDAQEKMADEP